MDWRGLTQDDLEAWRAAPVGECIRKALQRSLAAQRQAAMEAYMAGRAWSEADRLALIRAEALLEDWWEASADDFKATMTRMEDE